MDKDGNEMGVAAAVEKERKRRRKRQLFPSIPIGEKIPSAASVRDNKRVLID